MRINAGDGVSNYKDPYTYYSSNAMNEFDPTGRLGNSDGSPA